MCVCVLYNLQLHTELSRNGQEENYQLRSSTIVVSVWLKFNQLLAQNCNTPNGMKGHNCHKLFGLYIKGVSNTVTMKYIGRSLKFNRIVYRKYTKKYKFNIKILTFLKSNYKYKRRCLRKTPTDKMSVQRNSLHRRHIRNNNEMQKEKHQLPVEEDTMLKNNKNIMQRISIYDNTKLDKFLKIFILIMQQAQLTATTTINDDTRKNASNGLATRLVAKTKAIKNTNRSSSSSMSNFNEDEINRNHRAYKDANKDTDNNIDIGSNIVDEISHQQHNYDKVSTITSTPIKCQRRMHLQLNATKTFAAATLSPSSSSPSAPLASTTTTMTTSLSSPSVVVQTNYETYQWSAILRNCACDSPPIHHQYQYHHYHHKRKHIQHHNFYQQQRQHYQHQWQQHAVHIKSLTSRSLLSDNNNKNNNNNKSDSSSIKNNNRSHNSNTIDSPTCSAIAVYQTFDQYVNATWNRSYTISCLLLTLFIAFTIGIRSTTAGACWQTVLDNGKCNEIFSLNISKSECCGANQEFAYTEREPTNVEYFFATAIGGGMECSPCLESCRNVKCGPNKKCVKRKGRPKCICAPECGAARRRRKQREHSTEQEQRDHQHHSEDLFTSISKGVGDVNNEDDDVSSATVVQSSNGFNIKIDKSQQSRDIRSLSSEITNVNLGLKDGKHVMMMSNSGGVTSQMERHHSNNKEHNQNQRKLIHVHLEEHPYSQQQQQRQQNSKKSIDLQQYTHQMQQHQQEDQLRLQLEQQQTKRKDREPKGSRRLLITANVEHTEKPTTRRLQIFSNVRTTHARRRNSNKNKNNTSNSNSNRNNNKKKKNKNDQHEDTDPSDTDIDDKVVENDEDYNYNDTEDNEDNIESKMKYRSSNSNSNGNSNSNNNNKNNINRNDDATRFLNQSLSRHKLTTNIRVNNKNSNSSSHSHSKSSGNNSKNNERKTKRRKNHDLQRTEILQHHASDNNTRIRYPQQNQSHAVDISNQRHNRHQHRQQQQRKHNHHRQDFHNHNHHNHHKKHQQQQNHHRRHHGSQKFNRQKEPKNDKDYNATITVVSPIPITITPATYNNTSDTRKIVPFTTVVQSQVLNAALATPPLMNLSSSSSSSSSSALENSTSVIIVTTTPNQQNQPSRSQLLLSSSAMSSLSAATPVNSTLSALNSGAAAVDDADDFYHSHSQNHGSKIATSSLQSPSSTSSSYYSQPSVSASSELAFLPSVSAKGEGVSRYDHQHRRIQILASNKHNNNNNDNDDHKIAALNSNLHNNPQQQEEQKEQQHDQQPQAHQQYFHSTLFDAISDQIDFMGFSTKQQTITDAEFDRPLNPVCGTDGRTYNTECQLRKRACRTDNPNLQIAYRGHCRTTCNGVKCLNGLTCIEDQYSMPHCIACKIECPQDDCDNDVVDATKAVCGADGKTYKSVCDINRMICKIGRSIGVAYPGPCRVEQITCDDINCGPKQVCLIDWLTHTPRCTSCRYKCSRKRRPSFPHFEEGKICGVNNRTYNSWCEMRKDSCSTGFYIDLKYSGDCH